MYKFAPASADESLVFGSARPGYTDEQVRRWIEFVIDQDIQRVCCLLTKQQLDRYGDLLNDYRQAFGMGQVCWAPIEYFSSVTPEMLIDRILPFLATADQQQLHPVPKILRGNTVLNLQISEDLLTLLTILLKLRFFSQWPTLSPS